VLVALMVFPFLTVFSASVKPGGAVSTISRRKGLVLTNPVVLTARIVYLPIDKSVRGI